MTTIVNKLLLLALLALALPSVSAAQSPAPDQHDIILKEFKFRSVEVFPTSGFTTEH